MRRVGGTMAGQGIRIRLLGRVSIETADGRQLRVGGRHGQALFTLLATAGRPRSRESIAADLWPDELVGTGSPLRHALYQLRGGLASAGLDPDDILEADADTLALRPSAILDLDVAAFDRATRPPSGDPAHAVDLYGGDFAEGLAHDCFALERERLADRFEDALAAVAERCLQAGDVEGARDAAERLLARDPLREEAHAILLTVHGRVGSRAQVVRQYRRVRDVLARELGEPPLPETDAAYRRAMAEVVARSQAKAAELVADDGPHLVVVGR